MNVNFLNNKELMHLISYLKWYPDYFHIYIFLDNENEQDVFEKLIYENTNITPIKIKYQTIFSNNKVTIQIVRCKNFDFIGKRAQAIIFSENISYKICRKNFLPMLTYWQNNLYLYSPDYFFEEE